MEPNSRVKYSIIRWDDHSSFSDSSWKHMDKLNELTPFEVTSVGFVVNETEDYIILSSHFSFEEQVGSGEMCIIKKCIVDRKDYDVPTRTERRPVESEDGSVPTGGCVCSKPDIDIRSN